MIISSKSWGGIFDASTSHEDFARRIFLSLECKPQWTENDLQSLANCITAVVTDSANMGALIQRALDAGEC